MTIEVERRHAIAVLVSALAIAFTRTICDHTLVVELSDEAEEIIQSLIGKGHHKTWEEVLRAALETMMAQDGYPGERNRRSGSAAPLTPHYGEEACNVPGGAPWST
jgi:Arc/MetJ-type ribon-helix-helix transcriptional regulator